MDSKLKIFEIRNFREWEETLRKIFKSKIQKATTLVIMCVSKCDLNIIFKIMFKLMLLVPSRHFGKFWPILAMRGLGQLDWSKMTKWQSLIKTRFTL